MGSAISSFADFLSRPASLANPALFRVLFDLQEDVVICRITSVPHSSAFDVSIRDWKQAGLLKPSVVRLNRLVAAEKTFLAKRPGRLGAADSDAIKGAWNKSMRL